MRGIYPMVYILYVIFGCLFSIPAFFVLWLCYTLLSNYEISQIFIKTILALICPICTIITVFAIPLPEKPNMIDSGFIVMIGAYTIPLILGIFFFKLDTAQSTDFNNTPRSL